MSGPHLSDAVCRTGPARQRAVAAWLPCATPMQRLKAGRPRSRRPPLDRLAHAAVAPTASPTAPSPGPPPCHPNHLAHRSPVAIAPRHRLRTGEPPFPAVSRVSASCRRRLIEQRRRHELAPCATRCTGRSSWAAPAPRTRAAPHCASVLSVVSAQRHSN
jgi:hypothetical protein